LPLTLLAAFCFLCAMASALLFLRNISLYAAPPAPSRIESVSVLIPARNEERSIAACVNAALASKTVDLEVIVFDDHSIDRTAAIVEQIACRDRRVRLAASPALPAGWCGKQFSCSELGKLADRPVLCFLDADVRLQPDGLARMAAGLRQTKSALLSGFPRQITITPLEQMLLPLMHFLLLGFLPLDRMRRSVNPAFGAGCGQIFIADREAYLKAGGHEAIRESRHDGLTLPRAFRRAGFQTDLCDATSVASCRMYQNAREVIGGLLKNATEGLAAPKRIMPFSILLLAGQVLPLPLLAWSFFGVASVASTILLIFALLASYLPRIIAVFRYQQPLCGALLHPIAIALLLGIQWWALCRRWLRLPANWKGRTYSIP
jgi:glycosyl transferase family 2